MLQQAPSLSVLKPKETTKSIISYYYFSLSPSSSLGFHRLFMFRCSLQNSHTHAAARIYIIFYYYSHLRLRSTVISTSTTILPVTPYLSRVRGLLSRECKAIFNDGVVNRTDGHRSTEKMNSKRTSILKRLMNAIG